MAGRPRSLLRTVLDARAIAGVALVVALTGVTPADAVRAAKQALFASNAGAVNGIKASRAPHPNRLLPLGSDGRFPPSVLPPSGARGPRGAQGPAGPRGPSDARIFSSGGSVGLSALSSVPTQVAALNGLAPGSYLVRFTGVAVYREANKRMIIVCETRVNGAVVKVTLGIVGESAAASPAMPLTSEVPVTIADRSNISATCYGDQPSSAAPGVQQVSLSALSVANLAVG